MNPTTEARMKRVQDASRSHLTARVQAREQIIIDRLVLQYRSGTITNEALHGGIASIAELRSMALEAERDLMQATEDAENLTRKP